MPQDTIYPEVTKVRLPAGTLDLVRREAERQQTRPAEVMRRAIIAIAERSAAPRAAEAAP